MSRTGSAGAAAGVDWTWEQVPLHGVIELRVHGVGGTPAAEMLDDPNPVQVSGDRIAGAWRGHGVPQCPPRSVEAYSWGGLTERSLSTALWLVVLPFALVNLAGWMATTKDNGMHRGLVRFVGLGLTALYVLFAAVIGMDFAAYQCAGARTCATSNWWLIGVDGVAHSPAHRVVIGAVLPILVVVGLAVLTRVSRQRYDKYPTTAKPPAVRSVDGPAETGLRDPGFWDQQGHAELLAEIHHFTGLALVALLLSTTAASTTDASWAPVLIVVISVLLVLAAAVSMVTRLRRRLPRLVMPALGAVLVAAAAVVAWTGRPVEVMLRPLPGILETFNAVIGALYGGALLVLVIGVVRQARSGAALGWATRFRQAFTPFAVITLAGLMAPAVLAGAALWVAGWLGAVSSVGDPIAAQAAILYPQPFEALARGLVLVGGIALLAAMAAGVIAARRVGDSTWNRLRSALSDADPSSPGFSAGDNRGWIQTVRRTLRLPAASLAAAEWGLWSTAAAGVLAALSYSVFWLVHAAGPAAASSRYLDLQALPLPPLSLSIFLLTLLPLAAVMIMRQALRKPSVRRLVGIAWDVSTFWPRSFHPLCPPCYAERAVPEIQTRLRRIWAAGGAVALLGHSQGAVLVTAAIASLPEGERPPLGHLSLVTYGNPLHRLYARHFPAYVDDALIELVLARLGTEGAGAAANFYRDTDLVGHRLRPAEDPENPGGLDVYLTDPATERYFGGDQLPAVRGHAERGYRRQRAFATKIDQEVERLARRVPRRVVAEQPQPGPARGRSETSATGRRDAG